MGFRGLGLRVVISGVISPLIWVISIVTLLITLLIATHEPPSVDDLSKLKHGLYGVPTCTRLTP